MVMSKVFYFFYFNESVELDLIFCSSIDAQF